MNATPDSSTRRRLLRFFLFGAAALAVCFAWPQSAEACSVCLSASDETREAYYLTTVLMMLAPFAMITALLLWFRRALRRQDAT